jgi:uncharacterized protein YjcR
MTAADLAAIYHVSLRTIRRWAAEDNWAHRGWPHRYRATEALASYEKRRASKPRPPACLTTMAP